MPGDGSIAGSSRSRTTGGSNADAAHNAINLREVGIDRLWSRPAALIRPAWFVEALPDELFGIPSDLYDEVDFDWNTVSPLPRNSLCSMADMSQQQGGDGRPATDAIYGFPSLPAPARLLRERSLILSWYRYAVARLQYLHLQATEEADWQDIYQALLVAVLSGNLLQVAKYVLTLPLQSATSHVGRCRFSPQC